MADKTYINKCWIREKKFDSGGSVLNCGFYVDELKEHADDNGWVNIAISERRTPNEKGYTHYAYKDEWKPKDSDQIDADVDNSDDETMPWDD